MALTALTAWHLRAGLRPSQGTSPSIQNVPDQKTYLSIYFRRLGEARECRAISAISAVRSRRRSPPRRIGAAFTSDVVRHVDDMTVWEDKHNHHRDRGRIDLSSRHPVAAGGDDLVAGPAMIGMLTRSHRNGQTDRADILSIEENHR